VIGDELGVEREDSSEININSQDLDGLMTQHQPKLNSKNRNVIGLSPIQEASDEKSFSDQLKDRGIKKFSPPADYKPQKQVYFQASSAEKAFDKTRASIGSTSVSPI
jgi:hypothetical protein